MGEVNCAIDCCQKKVTRTVEIQVRTSTPHEWPHTSNSMDPILPIPVHVCEAHFGDLFLREPRLKGVRLL